MIQNKSQMEITISEKNYQFLCDQDSPVSQVKEALFQFLKFVGKIEDAIKESQEKKESPDELKEEVKPE